MTLILLPTSTATEGGHELDFAILDLTYQMLEDLERRCELAGQLKQQDLELSEVRWWAQSLEYYGYAIVQALLTRFAALSDDCVAEKKSCRSPPRWLCWSQGGFANAPEACRTCRTSRRIASAPGRAVAGF